MKKIEILVIGTNEEIMKVILRLINANPCWNATGVLAAEQAYATIASNVFDLVLLGAGLTPLQEQELTEKFQQVKPAIPTVKHYGGGSGLLFAEIYQALGSVQP
jgi:DNA-binding NtrC family response regulator